ncbi:MAG: HD domain-containing protein [Candidatus Methanoperedens sp.]
MEVRDPIHGLIDYSDIEEKIINIEMFQRLRGIKQLAFASLVYPGAHHTRFEHSLGAMHLAGKVGENLNLSDEQTKILRLAGLLHDIGHGPFSHVSEQIIEKYVDKSILNKYKAKNVQEMLSIIFIEKK